MNGKVHQVETIPTTYQDVYGIVQDGNHNTTEAYIQATMFVIRIFQDNQRIKIDV